MEKVVVEHVSREIQSSISDLLNLRCLKYRWNYWAGIWTCESALPERGL